MFVLGFCVGMIIHFMIWFMVFAYKKIIKNKVDTKHKVTELRKNPLWSDIHKNHYNIIEYYIQEGVKNLQHLDTQTNLIRVRGMSVINYLFLLCGSMFYIVTNSDNFTTEMLTGSVISMLLFFIGYIICVIMTLSKYFIVPSNQYSNIYNEPYYGIPQKTTQSLEILKIGELLRIQESIDNNSIFNTNLQKILKFCIIEVCILILMMLGMSIF